MDNLSSAYMAIYESKDDSYLETNPKKREENNKKAIEDMKKTDAHKSMVATARKKFDEETDSFDYLLEYLVAEGYADTNKEAIEIMSSMSDKWIQGIHEKLAHSFPLKAGELRSLGNIKKNREEMERSSGRTKSASMTTDEKPKRKTKIDMSKILVAQYLYNEGYADTTESAEIMAENISETWVDEILDEKHVKALDTTGRGADRRAHTTDSTVRPTRKKPTPEKYKHSEADFDSTLRSPSARKRKEERRQGTGGFSA